MLLEQSIRCFVLEFGLSNTFRRLILFPVVCFALIDAAHAQVSTLYFPRILTADEMITTGLAFINPLVQSSTKGVSQTLSFSLVSANGTTLRSASRDVLTGGQLAMTAAELFPNETRSGWIQVGGIIPGLQGFWLGGDFSTSTDGALAATVTKHGVLTLLTADTEISIANPSSPGTTGSDSVTLTLYSQSGSEIGRTTRTIPRNGAIQVRAADVFPAADFTTALHMHIQSDSGSPAITSVVKGLLGSRDTGVMNALSGDSFSSAATLNFPHVVSGRLGDQDYITLVGVTNLSDSNSSVTFSFTDESGATFRAQRTLTTKGSLREDVKTLLNLPSDFRNGWMSVSGPGIVGFLSYADRISGGLAVVPVQDGPRSSMLFPHVADLSPWYTGIALLNATDRDATIEVYAVTPTARLIGGPSTAPAARFTLAARSKRAFLLSEIIPATQLRADDGGFIYVKSTNNFFWGMELFFLRNLRVMANIAGGVLPTGASYTPPGAVTELSPQTVIADLWLEDAQGVRKTLVQPGDTTFLGLRLAGTPCSNCSSRWIARGQSVIDPLNKTVVDFATSDLGQTGGNGGGGEIRKLAITIPSMAGTYIYEARIMYDGRTWVRIMTFTVGGLAGTVPLDKHIVVDQFGYRPNDPKVAVIRNPQVGYDSNDTFVPGSTYQLRRAGDGTIVFSGTTSVWNNGAVQASSGDQGWWFDFSSVTTPDTYFVYDLSRNVRSATFSINQQVYKNILKAAMRMFFYQRSSFAKQTPYADACWADTAAYVGANQDTQARDVTDKNNNSKVKDLSGGWFDAGDTNKYVKYAVTPVHQLLTAYQNNSTVFTDDFNIPESGNGIPDVLDEVKWETDWLKKMQYADGSAALKVGLIGAYKDASPPSSDTSPRYYVPACTSSTIAVAGMFAHASYVYGDFRALSSEAADLKARAISAWNNYHGIAAKQTDCDSGEVHSAVANLTVDQQNAAAVVAAVYLYAITGGATYNDYVKAHYRDSYMRPYFDNSWSRYEPEQGEALLFYTTLAIADATVKNNILADKLRDVNATRRTYGFTPSDDLYRSFLPDPQYHWGSNRVRANYGNTNMDVVYYGVGAASTTTYRNRAVEALHYFHGVNPFGMVYLSNMYSYGATVSANQIYHNWFTPGSIWNDAKTSTCGPAPGYVPGGPNANAASDGVPTDLVPPTGQPPQKSYRDWNVSWNTRLNRQESSWVVTEPHIPNQSAYVKLLSAFAY